MGRSIATEANPPGSGDGAAIAWSHGPTARWVCKERRAGGSTACIDLMVGRFLSGCGRSALLDLELLQPEFTGAIPRLITQLYGGQIVMGRHISLVHQVLEEGQYVD